MASAGRFKLKRQRTGRRVETRVAKVDPQPHVLRLEIVRRDHLLQLVGRIVDPPQRERLRVDPHHQLAAVPIQGNPVTGVPVDRGGAEHVRLRGVFEDRVDGARIQQ
ncbi:MAG: hypothetical protein R3C10_09925 [Pirellulales bacterium]